MNTLIVIIVQLVTFGFAYQELQKWRSELVGKKKIELALEIGRVALEVRRAIKDLRSHAFEFGTPHAPVYPPEVDTDKARKDYDLRYLWSERFQKVSDPLQRLDQLSWEAEIVMGEDLSNLVEEYSKQYKTVWLAAQQHLFSRAEIRMSAEQWEAILNALYGKPGDDLDKQTEETARRFKVFARKHIEPSSEQKTWS